jgi:hypothetical protein
MGAKFHKKLKHGFISLQSSTTNLNSYLSIKLNLLIKIPKKLSYLPKKLDRAQNCFFTYLIFSLNLTKKIKIPWSISYTT